MTGTDLAPLHQPKSLAAFDAVRALLPEVAAVACFDTACHASLPAAAATYAVPREWQQRYGVRRYGFHGLSHAYCSRRGAELIGRPAAGLRLVTCHLGAGASLAAVVDGRSVDTTMGFTPLEGLVMATRSGTVDPGLVLWLEDHEDLSSAAVANALEHRSGLLALAGADMREVQARAAAGDEAAILAFDVFIHLLVTGIGAMTAAAGGLDLKEVAEVWRRGSVIGSWLLDLTAAALLESPALEEFPGRVPDSGEGRWSAIAAIEEGVPAATLASALLSRFGSRDLDRFANQVLSAMRKQFGGSFLFELLVPPTDSQARRFGDDTVAYDHELLADLTVRAITELQQAGVEPAIWKIQGMDERADDARAAAQARAAGRDHVRCVVLGHGEDEPRVRHWLEEAAVTPGYEGFAIGRTIWWAPLVDYLAARCSRDEATDRIARSYLEIIEIYDGARQASGPRD